MIEYTGILHHSVIVSDTQRSVDFYHGVLGLRQDDSRPNMSFQGAWLWVGEDQAIHLLELDNPDEGAVRPEHGGRDRHVALGVKNLTALIERLEAHQVAFTRSKSGRAAVFFRDPDDNAIEVIEQQG